MKRLLLFISCFCLFYTLTFSQSKIELKEQKRQHKDSVFFNRFNKAKFHTGLMLLGGVSTFTEIKERQYGYIYEFGYFVKNRLLLLAQNTFIYNNFIPKVGEFEVKQQEFYVGFSPCIRYYHVAKKITFFTQGFINYWYIYGDAEAVKKRRANFHRLDLAAGIGLTYSFYLFDLSFYVNYARPMLLFNKYDENPYHFHRTGLEPTAIFSITF